MCLSLWSISHSGISNPDLMKSSDLESNALTIGAQILDIVWVIIVIRKFDQQTSYSNPCLQCVEQGR